MAQSPDEKTYVELPFIEQLKVMGWDHIEGDIDVPYLTERESFRDVLLADRLRKAVKKINLDDNGNFWLDDDRINQVVSALERISAPKLMEANKKAFDLKPSQRRNGDRTRGHTGSTRWSLCAGSDHQKEI
jgi:type I restriction enzyme R subunit